MHFATAASALIALSVSAIAQDPQTWEDASAPASVTTATEATTTITKTLSLVHTETVYGASSGSSTSVVVASQTSSVAAKSTEAGAAPVATPTGVSSAATMSRDVVLAVIAAGAVAFWTS